jgi:anti-sigma factor RsiW
MLIPLRCPLSVLLPCPPQETPVKIVRALIAVAVALGAAVAVQMATSSQASAVPHTDACIACWNDTHE